MEDSCIIFSVLLAWLEDRGTNFGSSSSTVLNTVSRYANHQHNAFAVSRPGKPLIDASSFHSLMDASPRSVKLPTQTRASVPSSLRQVRTSQRTDSTGGTDGILSQARASMCLEPSIAISSPMLSTK